MQMGGEDKSSLLTSLNRMAPGEKDQSSLTMFKFTTAHRETHLRPLLDLRVPLVERVASQTQLSQIPWLGHFLYTSRTTFTFKIRLLLALIKSEFISILFVTLPWIEPSQVTCLNVICQQWINSLIKRDALLFARL